MTFRQRNLDNYQGQIPQYGAPQAANQEVVPMGQINSQAERYIVLTDPEMRRVYREAAEAAGLQFNPDSRLRPLVQSDNTTLVYNTALHPEEPISLNDNIPRARLRIYFQDPAFIRQVTCTVLRARWKPQGLPGAASTPAPPFEPQVLTTLNAVPEDYIFVQFRRDGAGQVYHEQEVPLSSVCGTGELPYLWSPIPVMKPGGSLQLDLSLIPPGQTNIPSDEPSPFIDSVGYIQIDMHVEKFQALGLS